jgi:hypothetical protein
MITDNTDSTVKNCTSKKTAKGEHTVIIPVFRSPLFFGHFSCGTGRIIEA